MSVWVEACLYMSVMQEEEEEEEEEEEGAEEVEGVQYRCF